MRGSDQQIRWANDIKNAFFDTLESMLTGDPRSNDALSGALDRIDNAPATWWIDIVGNAPDQQTVAQILTAIAQNKEWATNGID